MNLNEFLEKIEDMRKMSSPEFTFSQHGAAQEDNVSNIGIEIRLPSPTGEGDGKAFYNISVGILSNEGYGCTPGALKHSIVLSPRIVSEEEKVSYKELYYALDKQLDKFRIPKDSVLTKFGVDELKDAIKKTRQTFKKMKSEDYNEDNEKSLKDLVTRFYTIQCQAKKIIKLLESIKIKS